MPQLSVRLVAALAAIAFVVMNNGAMATEDRTRATTTTQTRHECPTSRPCHCQDDEWRKKSTDRHGCKVCECKPCKPAGLHSLVCLDKCIDKVKGREFTTGLPWEIVMSRVKRRKKNKKGKYGGCKKCVCKIKITTCDSFQCPINYLQKETPETRPGESTEACCNPSCALHACPTDYLPKDNPDTIPGASDQACCNPSCALHACPTDYLLKIDAHRIPGEDDITCCDPTCAVFICDGDHVVKVPEPEKVRGNTFESCCKCESGYEGKGCSSVEAVSDVQYKDICSAVFKVDGAGEHTVNGYYKANGEHLGKPRYLKIDSDCTPAYPERVIAPCFVDSDSAPCFVADSGYSPSYCFGSSAYFAYSSVAFDFAAYYHPDRVLIPPRSGWRTFHPAFAPAPTIEYL